MKLYKWYLENKEVKSIIVYKGKTNYLSSKNTMITKENNSLLFRQEMIKKLKKEKLLLSKKMGSCDKLIEVLKL